MTKTNSWPIKALHLMMVLLLVVSFSVVAAPRAEAAVTAESPATTPSLVLTPAFGPPTTNVTVTGGVFLANTLGILFVVEYGVLVQDFPQGIEDLDLLPASVIKPVPFTTDAAGDFIVDTRILENAPQGEATFVANVAGETAHASFEVWGDPTITLTPTDSHASTDVTIAGKWFDVPAGTRGTISASPAGVIYPVPFEVSDGAFTATATILRGAPLGPATFKATVETTDLAWATFTVTAPPPFDFSLTVYPVAGNVTQGEVMTPPATVNVTLEGGKPEMVTLGYVQPLPHGITIDFSPSARTPDFTSTMTIRATAAATVGTRVITIIGRGVCEIVGEVVREEIFTLTVEQAPPVAFVFELDVELLCETLAAGLYYPYYERIGINPGDSVTVDVFADHLRGPTERVTLGYEQPLPPGIIISFEPAAGRPDFRSAMTIAVAANATLSGHTITITGTGATANATDNFTLTVTALDFGVGTEDPHWAVVQQDTFAVETVSAALVRDVCVGLAENVTFKYGWYCPRWLQPKPAPEGVYIIGFTPPKGYIGYPYRAFGSLMHISATPTAEVDDHRMIIRGIALPSGLIREHHFIVRVTEIPFDFRLAVEPTEATLHQGQVKEATVNVTHLRGITEEVRLEPGELPYGVCVSFAPPSGVPGVPPYPFQSTMTIATTDNAAVGVHEITITGTGVGGLVREATFTLTIPFDFSLAAPDVTVKHGGYAFASVNVTHEEGVPYHAPYHVDLTYELPKVIAEEVRIFFKPSRGEPDPMFMSSMTVFADYTALLGEHEITITGTSHPGGVVRTTNFTLTVAAPAPLEPAPIPPFDIHLLEGWNLISLPLIPEDSAIEVVLADIQDDVIRVWHFDAAAGWKLFIPGRGGPLTEMRDGRGYWVYMRVARTLTVVGRVMPPPPGEELLPAYPLFAGWNHIGFKSTTSMTVEEYLGLAVMETFERMFGFDAVTGEWIPVRRGDNLQPGWGYWLWVSADGTIVPGILE